MNDRKAIIIGAGPAGLTAAYELLERTSIEPVILEADGLPGGLARTIEFKGNLIDIGGHRFFSKSDRVMEWWIDVMPIEQLPAALRGKVHISYQGNRREISTLSGHAAAPGGGPELLVRKRRSRILHDGKFFDYPITINRRTLANLGLKRLTRIVLSYLRAALLPRQENNLEDFFVNRFGRELYETFFREYTEKVWRVPCSQISPEWGAQRVKGLSGWSTFTSFVKRAFRAERSLAQKDVETSLIEWFLYPKLGSGQMWEMVSEMLSKRGAPIHFGHFVKSVAWEGSRISSVTVEVRSTGETVEMSGDYFFSSMPVRDLILAMGDKVPFEVRNVASGLVYKDFLTAGLLLDRSHGRSPAFEELESSTWLYVQEKAARVGRIQIFNNWSPYMVADRSRLWVGMEYFVDRGDPLWEMTDDRLVRHASEELENLGFVSPGGVVDGAVVRVPNAYPAYFGSYKHFATVRQFLDSFENLFCMGRNGMHRYNNQDHSMLTAMVAVDNIVTGTGDKSNLWAVNAESEYIESAPRPSGTR